MIAAMRLHERYLHFDTIDMEEPDIRSCCSLCGQEFMRSA